MNRPLEPAVAWGASGASVRGASHVRDGLPNQDAIAMSTAHDAAIVAIADGHGSPRHFRSALGARFAVDESVAVLRDLAGRIDAADAAARAQLASVELPQRIVEGWTVRTRAHLAQHPLTAAELRGVVEREGAAAADDVTADPLLAYGATVLAALVTADCIVLTQLGDGDILAVDADGTTTRPLPSDERLIGNLTTSICRAGAEGDFRSVVVKRGAAQAALLLSTDGYANSFKSDADFLQVGSDFVSMIGKDGIVAVERQLEAILQDASNVGSGDDITLAILQRVDASRSAQAIAPAAPVVAEPDARLVAAESHVRRMRFISGLALVVALVAVGWTWREHLPAWLKGGAPIVDGTPKIDLPKTSKPKGDHPTRPDVAEPLAPSPTGPKSAAGDGGIVAPAAPKIEDVKAQRVAGGLRVTARLAFDGAPDPACRFEASLWDNKDQRLESGGTTIAAKAARQGDHPTIETAPETIKAEALLAVPKDVERAKAFRAKDARYSAAVTCDGRAVAESPKQAIDG